LAWSTIGKRGEFALRFCVVSHLKGKREATEFRVPAGPAVGSEHNGLANAQRGVHDIVFGFRPEARNIAEADKQFDLGSEGLAIEF
jgi:hypothetical protein